MKPVSASHMCWSDLADFIGAAYLITCERKFSGIDKDEWKKIAKGATASIVAKLLDDGVNLTCPTYEDVANVCAMVSAAYTRTMFQ